jgi:DNA-binding transcriptional LysR family regulator
MLDWTLLKSFLAVLDTGSLSTAAARVGATQPTLSRHVQALEVELDTVLFRRSVHGLEPTPAALNLAEDARAMGRAAEALALKAGGQSQSMTGAVRLTSSRIIGSYVLPAMIADLRAAEPGIEVEIVASDEPQNLLRRDADLALRMFQPTQQALIARKLGDSPIGAYASSAYLARRGRPHSLADMMGHDIIGFDRSEDILKGFAAVGVPVTREFFPVRTDDQIVFHQMMLAGAGIGFSQCRVADMQPQLERLEIGLQLPPLQMWLVMHEEVRSNARIRRVADFLGEALTGWLRGDFDSKNG